MSSSASGYGSAGETAIARPQVSLPANDRLPDQESEGGWLDCFFVVPAFAAPFLAAVFFAAFFAAFFVAFFAAFFVELA